MRYLILGAGPAGLSFANALKDKGETSFLVLEREETAGGLCRSCEVDGAPLDIGGGHFLDVCNQRVKDYLFRFMPQEEWTRYTRDSRIVLRENTVSHPIEANIWQMDLDSQVGYLSSIAQAGCVRGEKMPEDFVGWIRWKLGDKIADEYMLPYNRKMFSEDLNALGTYWLHKLPDVSFEDTLRSCLARRPYGRQPGHAEFYYPKRYGYGELWARMAQALGDKIEYGRQVQSFDFAARTVRTADGAFFRADRVVTTIPWTEFETLSGMPGQIVEDVRKLKHSAVETRYYAENLNTEAQWLYCPDPLLAYHRILVRHNFCPNSQGYWTETRSDRLVMIPEGDQDNFHHLNHYAYPLNTIGKPEIMRRILEWSAAQGVFGLGRWGEHQHYNSDVTVDRALDLAERLA